MRRALALAALAWLLAASLAAAEDEETPDLAAAALPAPVAGLTVVIGGPDALTLRWDAPDDGGEPAVTRYEVERSEDGEQWVAVPLSKGPRALRDSPLTMGQRYWYRVRAVGEAGPGAWSEPVSGVPAAPPAAVDDLAVAEVRGGTVTLTWSQPAEHGSPIFRYELERLYGAGHDIGVGFWAFSEWPPEHETFSFDVRDALVTPGRAYRVRGWNAAGESEWSEPAIVEGADVPARPPRIAITAIGPREVSVRWQAATPRGSAVFSHEVERRYGLDHLLGYDHWAAEEWVAGRTWATIETSFTGVARTFRARAWNLVGEGAWSQWAGVQPGLLAVSGTHEEFREMLLAQCPRGFEVYGSPAAVGDARLIPYVIAPGGDDEAQRAANEVFAAAYPGGHDSTPLFVTECRRPAYLDASVRAGAAMTIYTGGIERLRHALETECAPGAAAWANAPDGGLGALVSLTPSADAEANAAFMEAFPHDRLWREPLFIAGCAP